MNYRGKCIGGPRNGLHMIHTQRQVVVPMLLPFELNPAEGIVSPPDVECGSYDWDESLEEWLWHPPT